ncbi:30S ribosomal protein S20 [Candidatus Jorgensenbacteria bacterium CG10_big_fil_rev_8_21_14_0_10_54_38]|uniref:Small ribosomal subunit protein bS20 n=2 Tax=Candidatus Joergenseniibacteriota TaxID=1752739 RepID=A0A2M6WG51_9BACT|nr:MAG: 30S ribosomal protein S20 [Candidatus Jorgensenbacteria bacterium CG23_combo_of_CG06-09_8_20_14_all_54_14]PIT91735.1 MAG: 30S ribosomal protein S20 [Candidatus Jorgensenbacteria bacterium CG10_big_fil_rev_8_21_14_0_10_54_38]
MPRTKTAKKALRQNVRRRKQNLGRKKQLRDALKTYRAALAAGKKDEARAALPRVYQTLDKLAKVHILKRGKAKRMKSRMAKKINPR